MKRFILLLIPIAAMFLPSCQKVEQEEPVLLTAPENVRLTAANPSGSNYTVIFSWDAVQGAQRYSVRLEDRDGELISSERTVTDTRAVFAGIASGTTCYFSVCAVSSDSRSDYSSPVEVVVGTTEPEPDTPDDNPDDGSDENGDGDTPDPASAYEKMMIPAVEDQNFPTQALAFPGAEGGGMFTTGGRGGKIIHVTNLNDSGTGSLRAALSESGPRIIVFDVAGVIHLNSALPINHGDVTIAGQTAPGDGICLADNTLRIGEGADNIIVRFIRCRLGDVGSGLGDGSDAFWGRYASNIIIDHCSMSWSIDEVASFYANRNFTLQWCIASEALTYSGVHSKGVHGYGGIWGGRNASFHHNLLADNYSRNARIDHPGIYDKYLSTHRGNVDYRNNVIYNWGDNSTYGGEDGHYNMVGNYYKPGPASKARNYILDAYWYNSSSKVGSAYPVLYVEGNHHTSGLDSRYPNGIYFHNQSSYGTNPTTDVFLSSPLPIRKDDSQTCWITTHAAADAYTAVLNYAGASLVRDAVDTRVTSDAREGKATYPVGTTEESAASGSTSSGGLIDSQSVVGGWPAYSATASNEANDKTDSDSDGLPDWFEEAFSTTGNLDPNSTDIDIYGRYTNMDMYLHYLVRNIVAAQSSGGTYTPLN